ncbi:hypothetical protein RND71_007319 [Anisodus tanguticus]|uniref:RmlD-like substrate binding domain-containing protein n=1 Tax=Anisodus tanguticus TaxID=243964 RepID=A0AAE1VTH6_9SOLA|nr:hypothetical protein RND71_007319 [Anisodus tanguticus]
MSSKKILIVGGTGYLGQHLVQEFKAIQDTLSLAFTYHTNPPPERLLHALPFHLLKEIHLQCGLGFLTTDLSLSNTMLCNVNKQPDVVVNCAALSVPRACEVDPAAAMAINVPSVLVKWLSSFKNGCTLLIHLSTDQVYEGTKSFYKEADEALPVNVYGRSKVAAEQFISANYSNFAILRSSIIYGPQTVSPVPKLLPVQWMDSVLAKGDAMDFFHDEFRCPVYVKDLVTIVWTLTNRWISEREPMQLLLNVGGPDRVSRVQMAEAVAHIRGYNLSLIKSVSSSTVNRGVKSPADISMDITRLIQTLNISPTAFKDGVKLTLEAESVSTS